MNSVPRGIQGDTRTPPQIDPKTSDVTRALLATALATAAVLLLVVPLLSTFGEAATSAEELSSIAADRGGFTLSHALFAITALLLAAGGAGIAMLVRGGRGTAATRTGAAMVVICSTTLALASWSYMVAGRVLTADGVDAANAATVLDAGNGDPVIAAAWVLGVGLFIGLIVLAIGLAIARMIPAWHAALIGAGSVLFFLSPGDGWLTTLMCLPLAAGLILLAPRITNLPAEQYSRTGQAETGEVPGPATSREMDHQAAEVPRTMVHHPTVGGLPPTSAGPLG